MEHEFDFGCVVAFQIKQPWENESVSPCLMMDQSAQCFQPAQEPWLGPVRVYTGSGPLALDSARFGL